MLVRPKDTLEQERQRENKTYHSYFLETKEALLAAVVRASRTETTFSMRMSP